MPLPPDYKQECLYTEDAWFVHDLLEVDEDHVLATMDTTRLGHIVAAQRTWPRHFKHVPGAVSIQVTGTLGSLHAVYGLGLRPTEGWFGFGTHIQNAKFPRMGEIGPPVTLRLDARRTRRIRGTVFADYEYTYTQDGETIYRSTQKAAWGQTDHRGPCPE